ncbi:hypothetical protein EDB92DRAFT_1871358, partial [Lactarius akahatsu]
GAVDVNGFAPLSRRALTHHLVQHTHTVAWAYTQQQIGELCVSAPAHSPINVFLHCTDPLHVLSSSSALSLSFFPFALVERWHLCPPSFDSLAVALRLAVFSPHFHPPFWSPSSSISGRTQGILLTTPLRIARLATIYSHFSSHSTHGHSFYPHAASHGQLRFVVSKPSVIIYVRLAGFKKDVTKCPPFRKEVRSRVRSYVSACSCASAGEET